MLRRNGRQTVDCGITALCVASRDALFEETGSTGHVTLTGDIFYSTLIFVCVSGIFVYIVDVDYYEFRMSTFGGLMKEYRLISLDRFDGINLESTVYMLSHKHSGNLEY